MREKFGLWIAVLALLSFFAVLVPGQAFANVTDPCNGTNDPTNPVTPNSNPIDTAFSNNVTHTVQGKIIVGDMIAKMFPIAPALSACVKKLTDALTSLGSLADPFDPFASAIALVVTSLITQVCSAAVGAITQIETDIKEFLTICLPLPNFNFNLPRLQAKPCLGMGTTNGGLQIPLLGGPMQPVPGPPTPASQTIRQY